MEQLPLVAIIGRANVGKSSLFNRLIGSGEAIVAREAGTTRDPVKRVVRSRGRSFLAVDTAGLLSLGSSPKDRLEADLQSQTQEAIEAADLILMVVDAATGPTNEDRQISRQLRKSERSAALVINKIDKTKLEVPAGFDKLGLKPMVGTSATTKFGITELLSLITNQLPIVKPSSKTYPAISLVGRPNVGKSSLFNALSQQTAAVVSPRPHTTRDVNQIIFKSGQQTWQLFDTGGIRRPGKRAGIEAFSYLRTARAVAQSDVVILVLDAREPAVGLDQKIASLVKDASKGLILVVNKWDLIAKPELARLEIEQLLQNQFGFVWWAPVIFTSAKTKLNLAKILELAGVIIKQRHRRFDSDKLTEILRSAVRQHPPVVSGKPRPKLTEITQTGTAPPQFTVQGRGAQTLHTSYRRYLETQLRQHLAIIGTPIELRFKTSL